MRTPRTTGAFAVPLYKIEAGLPPSALNGGVRLDREERKLGKGCTRMNAPKDVLARILAHTGKPHPMRNALLSLSLCALALNSSAQEFRLSGGYNGTNVTDAGNEHWVGRAGYQFGADLVLGHRWFLKPGVHFLVRNIDYSYAAAPDVSTQNYSYTSRSLLVPVMLGINLLDATDDPAINVNVFGGPSALMNLNADLDNSALNVETTGTQWYLGFGAGATLGFLFVEGGYDVAMSNVFKGDDFHTNPKANFLYASVGVRLQLAH